MIVFQKAVVGQLHDNFAVVWSISFLGFILLLLKLLLLPFQAQSLVMFSLFHHRFIIVLNYH